MFKPLGKLRHNFLFGRPCYEYEISYSFQFNNYGLIQFGQNLCFIGYSRRLSGVLIGLVKLAAGVTWCLVLDRPQRILFIRFILCTVILHCQAYPSTGLTYALYVHHFLAVRLAGDSQGMNQIKCLYIYMRERERDRERQRPRQRQRQRETELEILEVKKHQLNCACWTQELHLPTSCQQLIPPQRYNLDIDLMNLSATKQQKIKKETTVDPVLNSLGQVIYTRWPATIQELPKEICYTEATETTL